MSEKKQFDDFYRKNNDDLIVGVDEVGRGCLAGPLFVCALILNPNYDNPEIDDSKKISKRKREKLKDEILSNCIEYAISVVFPQQIDATNIYKATLQAMQEAINKLKTSYNEILVDYMPVDGTIHITHGDAKSLSIGAASIVAKVLRDEYMNDLNKKYPLYKFDTNVGYGTKEHLDALNKYGPIEGVHRYSYKPIKDILFKKITLF